MILLGTRSLSIYHVATFTAFLPGQTWNPTLLPLNQLSFCTVVETGDVPQVDILHAEASKSCTESLIAQGILCTLAKPVQLKHIEDLPKAVLPSVNSTCNCLLTEVQSVDSFYVQPMDGELITKIQELTAAMTATYAAGGKGPYTPQQNELIAAVFPDDQQWYRAHVNAVSPKGDEAKVQFVDYGNCCRVRAEGMAVLDDKLMAFPVQSVHCQLHEVSMAPGAQLDPALMPTFQVMGGKLDQEFGIFVKLYMGYRSNWQF